MPNPTIDLTLTSAQKTQLAAAFTLIKSKFGPLIQVWDQLTPKQRVAVLEHSPVFAKLYELAAILGTKLQVGL